MSSGGYYVQGGLDIKLLCHPLQLPAVNPGAAARRDAAENRHGDGWDLHQ